MKLLLLALSSALLAWPHTPALARSPTSANPWQEECGGCHVLFPARLLTAENWRALMTQLDRHFGSDASVDDASRAEIAAYLEQNAAPDGAGEHSAASLRITDTDWFVRKHQRKAARLWLSGKIRSAVDCGACHKGPEAELWR